METTLLPAEARGSSAENQALDVMRPMRSPGVADLHQLGSLLFEGALGSLGGDKEMEHALRWEWLRCAEQNVPLTLMLMRADPFSGPDANTPAESLDLCRHAVAASLRTFCIRPRDGTFRTEEDVFIALLPTTPADGSRHVAGSIIGAVRDLQIALRRPGRIVPLALGSATTMPATNGNPFSLIEHARHGLGAAGRHAHKALEGAYASATAVVEGKFTVYWNFFRTANDVNALVMTD
jgi:GGDEF domain-containing protein